MKNFEIINGIFFDEELFGGWGGWITIRGSFHTELISISSYKNYILMTVGKLSHALPQEIVLLWNTKTDGVPTSTQLYDKAMRWIKRHFDHDMWEKEEALSVWDD